MVTEKQMFLMIAWVLLLTIIYFIAWHFYDRYQENKYPENIRKVLNAKYASLKKHKKAIRKVRRRENKLNIFGIKGFKVFGHDIFDLSYEGYRSIKNHRYLVNKTRREINGIKEHFGK